MRINFIIPFKRMSGGIRVIYIYANYLTSKGHDVCCYLPAISYPGKNQSALFRLKASISNAFKKENWFDCKFPVKVVPRISNKYIREADVVIATAWQTAYDVNRLSNNKGRKFYFVQGLETYNGDLKQIESTFSMPFSIITISNSLSRHILKFNSNVNVIYNGLFQSEFIDRDKRRSDTFKIMVLFHEEPSKGTDEGISIITALKEEGLNVEGIVFGRKITNKYPQYIRTYKDPERDLLKSLYTESDVFLFTSTNDAWGLTVAEAAANKCAVIGRKIGIIDELYDGSNFCVVTNSDEMLDAVRQFYDNHELLRSYQEKCYKTAQLLEWKHSCGKFESILETQ